MLRTELNEALKTAMKEKDETSVSTLRLIVAALKDRDIAARSKGNQDGIGDDDILGLLQSMVIIGRRGRPRLRSVSKAEKLKLLNIFHKSIHRHGSDPRLFAAESDVNKEGVFVK